MHCSVYAAQYLLEGLFQNGGEKKALALITAATDRSWRHMVDSGTTITWEAWDLKYKPNQDWNHAWGAAPANLLPRYVLGAEPLEPGWKPAKISPRIGNLSFAKGKVPSPKGPISIHWKNEGAFTLQLVLPDGMEAKVDLPMVGKQVLLNGKPVKTTEQNGRLVLDDLVEGTVVLDVR
jgi:hypothetical protein